MGCGAAELVVVDPNAGELRHHRRPGHERVRVHCHHHEVGDPQHSAGPRDGRSFDDHDDRHDARTIGHALAASPQPHRSREAPDDVGATRPHDHDQRKAFGALRAGGVLDLAPRTPTSTHRRESWRLTSTHTTWRPSEPANVGADSADDPVTKLDGLARTVNLDSAAEGECLGAGRARLAPSVPATR